MPESHTGARILCSGLRSALKQQLIERRRAIESLEQTNPHTSEYDRFHFAARQDAKRFEAAFPSFLISPSTEMTSGVKVRRRAMQSVCMVRVCMIVNSSPSMYVCTPGSINVCMPHVCTVPETNYSNQSEKGCA